MDLTISRETFCVYFLPLEILCVFLTFLVLCMYAFFVSANWKQTAISFFCFANWIVTPSEKIKLWKISSRLFITLNFLTIFWSESKGNIFLPHWDTEFQIYPSSLQPKTRLFRFPNGPKVSWRLWNRNYIKIVLVEQKMWNKVYKCTFVMI